MLWRPPLLDPISRCISLVPPLVNVKLRKCACLLLDLAIINVVSLQVGNLLNLLVAVLVWVGCG